MKVLITGGTTFVSKAAAIYFVEKGYETYVLNRGSKPQVPGVHLIEADRHDLGDKLEGYGFDAILDVTAYDREDVSDLLDALDDFGCYILVSSSAVYPETEAQPFREETRLGVNRFWGKYGTDKIGAEEELVGRVGGISYILRPPYIYGPMDNVYREAFVFDCAINDRPFYLPKDGSMKLHFLYVYDLCEMMEAIILNRPEEEIFNVGNSEAVTIRQWVELCYKALGKKVEFVEVHKDVEQRNYFSFHDYEYILDVGKQNEVMTPSTSLEEGLKAAAEWYLEHEAEIKKKNYMQYIDENLKEDQ